MDAQVIKQMGRKLRNFDAVAKSRFMLPCKIAET